MVSERPTQVQAEAIPSSLDGRCVCIQPQQGQAKQLRLLFQRYSIPRFSTSRKRAQLRSDSDADP